MSILAVERLDPEFWWTSGGFQCYAACDKGKFEESSCLA